MVPICVNRIIIFGVSYTIHIYVLYKNHTSHTIYNMSHNIEICSYKIYNSKYKYFHDRILCYQSLDISTGIKWSVDNFYSSLENLTSIPMHMVVQNVWNNC